LKRLPVRWTASAYADLFEIVEFIDAGKPATARRLGRDILKQARTLGRNAQRGRLVPELLEHGLRDCRDNVVSRHRIVYRVHPEAIQIAAAFDGRRDVGDLLLRRLLR
jgi:toxin ParE1/3/4